MSDTRIQHAPNRGSGFDSSEPQAKAILVFAIATIATLAAVIGGVQMYFDKVWQEQVYEKVLAPPSEELRNLRAREDSQLFHYSYADRNVGKVRIPIARAMELYAKEVGEEKFFYPTKPMAPKPEVPEGAAVTTPAAQKASPAGKQE